jgi:hypothetical protein
VDVTNLGTDLLFVWMNLSEWPISVPEFDDVPLEHKTAVHLLHNDVVYGSIRFVCRVCYLVYSFCFLGYELGSCGFINLVRDCVKTVLAECAVYVLVLLKWTWMHPGSTRQFLTVIIWKADTTGYKDVVCFFERTHYVEST